MAGSLISANAAGNAADTQAAAAQQAAQLSSNQNALTRSDLSPYRDLGGAGTTALAGAMPFLTSTFNPTIDTVRATPGYQFTLDQGLKSVQNAAAARGLGISGAALKGASSYATGLADSTYKDQFNIDQTQKNNIFNKLFGIVNTGENAAAQTGVQGTANTGATANALTSGANASAAGDVGAANAIASGLNSVGNTGTNYLLLSKLLSGSGGSGTKY